MSLDNFISKWGGLHKRVQKQPQPKTIGQIFEKSWNTQKERGVDGKGSWYNDGKLSPKVGIHKLFNGDDGDYFVCKKNEFNDWLDDLMTQFKNGNLEELLLDVQKRREESNKKRREKSKE